MRTVLLVPEIFADLFSEATTTRLHFVTSRYGLQSKSETGGLMPRHIRPWLRFHADSAVYDRPMPWDTPNRFLAWAEVRLPWRLTVLPVFDTHTGFPYSAQDGYRDYVGPRNTNRLSWFSSTDLQVLRPVSIPFHDHHIHARAGLTVFNVFNHFNPRDVQTIADSPRYGQSFNNAWREYRGKFVFEF